MAPAVTVVADPEGTRVWAYACRGCHRIGGVYFLQAAADRDADTHDCDRPRANETTDLRCDTRFAALKAAAWATFLDGEVALP